MSNFIKNYMTSLMVTIISWDIESVHGSCYDKFMMNRGLKCTEKRQILELHNEMRQIVALGQVRGQPAAKSMMTLKWDEELARKAQNLADTCKYGHDSLSTRSVSRFPVGQNIATTWSTWEKGLSPDFRTQIKAWFEEVYRYSFNSGFSHETGHYSQMVWGDTYLVGCGYSYFYDGYKYQKVYICNYGPGGNVLGRAPYKPGYPSCSRYSPKYQGLCEKYTNNYPDYSCSLD